MNELLFLKLAHIVAFVYWLGGDLGTFLASKHVINAEHNPESRHVALKIMLACDQGPKISMPLILALGTQIGSMMGFIYLPTWTLVGIWGATIYWLVNVLVLYAYEGKQFTARLSKIDFYFRIIVVVAVVIFALHGLNNQELIRSDWVSYKLLVFASLVTCGILIRINLKPFIPAFTSMMQHGATAETNSAMQDSIRRCRPYVWVIWLGLFVNAALGLHLI